MRHHTKDKGDRGLGFVVADFLKNGIQVALPISEHLPFDCIAISEKNILKKISVKYRAINSRGILEIPLRSSWADRHGSHTKHHEEGDYDAFAVYCPDTDCCYYVNWNEILGTSLTLRIRLPANNQKTGVRLASDHIGPSRIFE